VVRVWVFPPDLGGGRDPPHASTCNPSQGRILLEPWVGIDDINMLNVNVNGTFENERFRADDSGLPGTPQLVNTVTEAKKLVLSTAKQ